MSDFYIYFKENMDSLGLPAPETLFGTMQAAVANAAVFLSHIDKFGKTVTVGEMLVAGTKLEKLGTVAALSAAFYAGAVIGSIAIATGRTVAGGTSLADVLLSARRNHISRPWLASTLYRWPGIYSPAVSTRRMYRHSAVQR